MERKPNSFEQQLKFGEEGEHEVARLLIEKGISVMPLYQFNPDHPPYILTKVNSYISPDLICFGRDSIFIEVKSKNQWVYFNGRRETGFNKRHYDDYLNVKNATGKKLYIFFNHVNNNKNIPYNESHPVGIYYVELENYTRFWDGSVNGKHVHKPTIFYNYDVLEKLSL